MAVTILAMVAAVAAWVPTRRAVRVDPANTLRLE
jgi:ABC-type lipoprotein release transport system permease subunit